MGPKASELLPARGQRLDGHTALEVALQFLVHALEFDLGRGQHGLDKLRILFPVQRAVDVVALVAAQVAVAVVAALAEGDAHVDGTGHDDGRHRIVEIEMALPGQRLDLRGERGAGERAGGDDGRAGGDRRHFLPVYGDERVAVDAFGDLLAEVLAADGQRRARGQRVLEGRGDHQAAQARQFLLEDAQRAVGQGAAHRVAADQLGQAVGDVRLGAPLRAHFVRDEPGSPRLAICQAASVPASPPPMIVSQAVRRRPLHTSSSVGSGRSTIGSV
jgi:hypothetical protein